MPTYVYKFIDTGETIEVQQAFTDPTLTESPTRRRRVRPVKKVFQPVGVTFKGSGFYKTDSRGGSAKSSASSPPPTHRRRVSPRHRATRPRPRAPRRSRSDIEVVRHKVVGRRSRQHSGSPKGPSQSKAEQKSSAAASSELISGYMAHSDQPAPDPPMAEIGIFGGSGFYEFLDDVEEVVVATPYGDPAAPVTIGTVGRTPGRVPARHGRDHQFAAHRVPFRANVYALWSLGVALIVAPCSVGSLQPDLHPGDFVVDRPARRSHLGPRRHLPRRPAGPPPDVRRAVRRRAAPGPRRRRAVDRSHGSRRRHDGRHQRATVLDARPSRCGSGRWAGIVVNMTGYPEAVLAAELGHARTRPSRWSPTTTPESTAMSRSRWRPCSRSCTATSPGSANS